MNTLTIALTAALLAGSAAPEKVSTETKEAPIALQWNGRLSGTVKGTCLLNAHLEPTPEPTSFWAFGRSDQVWLSLKAGMRRFSAPSRRGRPQK